MDMIFADQYADLLDLPEVVGGRQDFTCADKQLCLLLVLPFFELLRTCLECTAASYCWRAGLHDTPCNSHMHLQYSWLFIKLAVLSMYNEAS